MNRRDLLKNLTAAPFAAIPLSENLSTGPDEGVAGGDSIYASVGVEPIINCRGTFTIIGGSMELPEVTRAMEAASGYFVQYDELAMGVGKRLAELTKSEWGIVTSGCAAAMKHFTAACLTGGNPEKLLRIPDLTGFEKTEVIIPRSSRNVYDHAIRNMGVSIIEVNSPEDLERAINPRTAMIYIMTGPPNDTGKELSLEVIASIAKPHSVPILADAAAENLTIPPIHLERGATAVAYSGGKAICGPQCAGILLGPKDLLMSAWQASAPHHGPGRDNKVGKEEIMGMLAAVEAWTERNHEAEWNIWLERLNTIASKFKSLSGISTEIRMPTGLSNRAPALRISWNPNQFHITGEEVAEITARSKPRIAIGGGSGEGTSFISIVPSQMRQEQVPVVADRLYAILSAERSPKSDQMASPSLQIDGPWDLEIQYFSSIAKHTLYIEQDGNWIQGTHQADFSESEVLGLVEGDQIKMRSVLRRPGDSITYLFSGVVKNDEAGLPVMSGSIHLGEYMTAKFKATKTKYKGARRPFMIPGGPPLSS
ncbi:MAG TPA: aminotransferase class V-fold PLP-dependent enzyme [Saprospiraceae bacterium]|nr:aminotransferase class V-fold PLP-dependent enzyme [Saprospiraceae bacterium]HNT19114.1 aminotransferase class V-fold PLP-dependent enzyme [Saprospiraceae bacterium]